MSQLKIAVHWTDKLDQYSYSHRWVEYLTHLGVDVLKIDLKCPDIIDRLRDNGGCDGVMWHWYHIPDDKQSAPKILDAIESCLEIPVFPDYHTRWHYDEKIAQYYLFEALDLPRIKTWVFWDYKQAIKFCQNATYPLVFKLSVGAASANVIFISSYQEAKFYVDKTFKQVFFPYSLHEFAFNWKKLNLPYWKSVVKRSLRSIPYIFRNEYPPLPEYYLIQKNYAYFQEFCSDNPYDIRITVIGDRAFGFTRENRIGDFRASGSGKVDYDLKKIPLEAVELSFKASRLIKAQSMAYDIMYDNQKNLVINEATYCFVHNAVFQAPGHWDSNLIWHEGNVHPNDAQAEDFIHCIQKRKEDTKECDHNP